MIPIYAKNCIPCGRIDHYYHHVIDYVVPLWMEMQARPDWMLARHDVPGALAHHMAFWFQGRCTSAAAQHQIDIRGLGPRRFGWVAGRLIAFGHSMQAQAGADPNRDLVLYVRRGPASAYYKSRGQTAGSDRRFLARERETIDLLDRVFGEKFRVVSFEGMTAAEQVWLCSQAAVLIGVHGAGLLNLLFTPSEGAVVEVTYRDAPLCNERLAAAAGRRYIAVEGRAVRSDGRCAVHASPEDILAASVRAYGD